MQNKRLIERSQTILNNCTEDCKLQWNTENENEKTRQSYYTTNKIKIAIVSHVKCRGITTCNCKWCKSVHFCFLRLSVMKHNQNASSSKSKQITAAEQWRGPRYGLGHAPTCGASGFRSLYRCRPFGGLNPWSEGRSGGSLANTRQTFGSSSPGQGRWCRYIVRTHRPWAEWKAPTKTCLLAPGPDKAAQPCPRAQSHQR